MFLSSFAIKIMVASFLLFLTWLLKNFKGHVWPSFVAHITFLLFNIVLEIKKHRDQGTCQKLQINNDAKNFEVTQGSHFISFHTHPGRSLPI